jgi:uncharacterized protein YcfJ
MQNYKTLSLVLGAALLVVTTAGASVYLSRQPAQETATAKPPPHAERVVVTQPVQRKCDDGNIAGKAVGGVGGGVLGSMVGKGSGKTAATIGGTLGGAYIGGEAIPLNNITCK